MDKYDKQKLEAQLAKIVVDTEYAIGLENNQRKTLDFEDAIDMLECERTSKNASWMSDIFLPEYPSHILTDSAMYANQYFTTRDYVECYLEDGRPGSKQKAAAAQECLNRTLNQRHLFYYQKFMRARIINTLGGEVYARCWWEKETKAVKKTAVKVIDLDVDEYGDEITDPDVQVPAKFLQEVEVDAEDVVVDRFNFDIIDPRNVFTDNTFTYSLQEKDWVIIRFERTLEQLQRDADRMGYINLDQLKDVRPPQETDTSKETYNAKDQHTKFVENKISKPYDILERHGKFWVIVDKEDDDGYPLKISTGIDEFGERKKNAKLIETIITFAVSASSKVLIRFQPQPYRDWSGMAYKPLVRGLCYVHPTRDVGLGDGKYVKEIQVAINDTFNLSNDRVLLATLPTLKGRKSSLEDNPTVYFEPNHTIHLDNPDDLQEFKISDDIGGALNQIAMLTGKMQQLDAIYPTTMGQLPAASTTATAVAGTEQRSTTRSNYKSLTFENTFLTEFYWMALQMTNQFAEPETGELLMGEKVYDFAPDADYLYKPVSQAIETEYSKATKKKEIIAIFGYVAQVPNPKTPAVLNKLLADYFTLNGDESDDYRKILLDESVPPPMEGGVTNTQNVNAVPVSNQNGQRMSGIEQAARGMV